jgi:hypothetical protein
MQAGHDNNKNGAKQKADDTAKQLEPVRRGKFHVSGQ